MSLRKEIRVGDELYFDLATDGVSNVKILLSEVVGRRAILVITANKESVPIKHIKALPGHNGYGGFVR